MAIISAPMWRVKYVEDPDTDVPVQTAYVMAPNLIKAGREFREDTQQQHPTWEIRAIEYIGTPVIVLTD